MKKFQEFNDEKDSATLLKEIKVTSYEYEVHMNPYLVLDDTKTKLYGYSKITSRGGMCSRITPKCYISLYGANLANPRGQN